MPEFTQIWLCRANGHVQPLTLDLVEGEPRLHDLRQAIFHDGEGLVEAVTIRRGGAAVGVMWCDEEGLLKPDPSLNLAAMDIMGFPIFGDVVFQVIPDPPLFVVAP